MARTIAPLVYYDRVDGSYIKMGTGSWLNWLAQNRSFRYESFWGSFTACKEHRGEEIFWVAYRRFKGQERCAELGASENLTLDNLLDTAKKLSASNMAPWEGKPQIQNTDEAYSYQLESSPKIIETNSVRQWCIFFTHLNGEVEFLGACWEKEQAFNQLKNMLMPADSTDPFGGLNDRVSGRYEVREELVMPSGYTPKKLETNRFDTQTNSKEIELLHQVSDLREQLSKLQRQLEQERRLNMSNDASAKFLWN
ncbi:hypothetical protein [Allocoleopsis sp.]|uniref:hypothetical protein n=1 Tax=Allocoleopsis sp. TaxID=3088169 RepID=UPI002FCEA9B9